MKKVIKIGTRPSDLALMQVRLVLAVLRPKYPDINFIVVPVKTTGDIRRDTLDLNVQDKKQWVIELEERLVSNGIDFVIHCAKDVPLQLDRRTGIMTVFERENSEDVMLFKHRGEPPCPNCRLSMLSPGALIGTSSKRRKSQILRMRPDLLVTLCRGNVPTRIAKLKEGVRFDALILAKAGLKRLDLLPEEGVYTFTPEEMVPAIGQGTLLAQFLETRDDIKEMLSHIVHNNTNTEYFSERACVDHLGADCHSSLGVYAKIEGSNILIRGRVLSEDGIESIETQVEGEVSDALALGKKLGVELMSKGACSLL